MTHDDLIREAIDWLEKRCAFVAAEPVSYANEVPDAIGWESSGHSILVGCKTSRADFLREERKCSRRVGVMFGAQRFYLTPPGIVGATEALGWGVIEVHPHITRVVRKVERHDLSTHEQIREMRLLTSLARRAVLHPVANGVERRKNTVVLFCMKRLQATTKGDGPDDRTNRPDHEADGAAGRPPSTGAEDSHD